MRRAIVLIMIVFVTALAWKKPVYAATPQEEIYETLCDQLRRGNRAVASWDGSTIVSKADFEEYVANECDEPDCLYDGAAMFCRGDVEFYYGRNFIRAVIERGFEIEDAEELTDRMVKEISAGLKEGASDREKMAAICKYLTDIYDYDKEALALIEEKGDGSLREDFVSAYYGDRRIMCSEYSMVTYLVANKMGVKCDVSYCIKHVFNVVKFEDSDCWFAYDLTSDRENAEVDRATYDVNSNYHLDEALAEGEDSEIGREAAFRMRMNRGITYELAEIEAVRPSDVGPVARIARGFGGTNIWIIVFAIEGVAFIGVFTPRIAEAIIYR